MPMRVLAVNRNGDVTYCTCPPELRGTGRCNHVGHQEPGENPADFLKRVEELVKPFRDQGPDTDTPFGDKPFIPLQGTIVSTRPYRMTEVEKQTLVHIQNKRQLEQELEAGYIELEEPLWNDMDKNYFAQQYGMPKRTIESVLWGKASVVLESDSKMFPVGRVVPNEMLEEWKRSGEYPRGWSEHARFGTGVLAMNEYAQTVGFTATKDVYVLPYYLRMGVGEHFYGDSSTENMEQGEEDRSIPHDITFAYQYLLRNHANPDRQQLAYEALLNNSGLNDDMQRRVDGYPKKGLSDYFAGKGGVFRAVMSGQSIPYGGRAVIIPNAHIGYGYVAIPPAMAVDIFRPTILRHMISEGKSSVEIDGFIERCRLPQTQVPKEDMEYLQSMIEGKRVAMNRQPSLHNPSFQSFRPKISDSASAQIHPAYCSGYNADFDGDEASIYAFNQDGIIPVLDRTIDSHNPEQTHLPRNFDTLLIGPKKDAMFGIMSILAGRSQK